MIVYRLVLFSACCFFGLAHAHPGQQDQLARATRSIAQHPDTQALYIQRGMIYSTAGEFEEATADYTRAEQLGPAVLVAFDRGVLYYRMGDFGRATYYLDQYLEQFPSSAVAFEYRARTARGAGNYQRALADLNSYFELQDNPNPGHYISAAEMLREMGRIEQALTVLDQGLDKLGTIPQLQRHAIGLELARQQTESAITRLETLRVPLNENPGWKLQMAELLILANRRSEADAFLLQAEAELAELRPTPARLELQRQARELKK